MPLARIITHLPEHTGTLSQQLQLEGYEVEIAAPGELHNQPADLEIDFALCNPAEALELASQRARELGADVVVAPGVLELAMQPGEAAVEPQPETEVVIQPETEPVPLEVRSNETVSEPVVSQRAEEDQSHELPSYNPHFARNLGVQLREALTNLGATAIELQKRLAGHLRTTASRIASRALEYQVQLKQRAAERQAARRQQPAEIANLQTEAQEPSVAGFTTLELPEPQLVPEPEPIPAATTAQESPRFVQMFPAVSHPAAARQPMPPKQRAPLQLRGIFTGAAVASILFIVGLVVANVHQPSPLPPSMTQTSVEQHVPFGAIIVQGTRSNATAVPPVAVAPAPKPQPSTTSQTTTRKKPHPYHRSASIREGGDVSADDVTVRHFPSSTPRRPVQQQAKFKRYSDRD